MAPAICPVPGLSRFVLAGSSQAKGSGSEQGGQEGLLGMETIFGLVKHPAG